MTTQTITPTNGQITGQRVRYEIKGAWSERIKAEGFGRIVAFTQSSASDGAFIDTQERVVVQTDDGRILFLYPSFVRVIRTQGECVFCRELSDDLTDKGICPTCNERLYDEAFPR